MCRADVIGFRVAVQLENLVTSGADAGTVAAARAAALSRLMTDAGASSVAVQELIPMESAGEDVENTSIDWDNFDPYHEMQGAMEAARRGMRSTNTSHCNQAVKLYAELLQRWERHQEGEDVGAELVAFIDEIEAERVA